MYESMTSVMLYFGTATNLLVNIFILPYNLKRN